MAISRFDPSSALRSRRAIFWRASQGSNLEPSDLESDALPIGATDPSFFRIYPGFWSSRLFQYLPESALPAFYSLRHFAFFVYGVRAASRTEFLDRKFVGLGLLVLGRGVVARLAGVA
jgi:hypothetical protein